MGGCLLGIAFVGGVIFVVYAFSVGPLFGAIAIFLCVVAFLTANAAGWLNPDDPRE